MTAAMGAALHALELSGADQEITTALIEQLDTMRTVLAQSSTRLEAVPLKDLCGPIQSFATLHQLVIDLERPMDVAVLADRVHVAEILQNLMDNSRKYAPGSPVAIGYEEAGPSLRITVDDSGPGIEQDGAETLFLPGVRGSKPTQGFGTGLAVARRKAEAMQGALWYERRPGGGSRFVLRLPMAYANKPEEPPSA
jgi:signal transduction histidine kinase